MKTLAKVPQPPIKSRIQRPADTVENIHKVPLKRWNRWNRAGKEMFNYLCSLGINNADVIFSTDLFDGGLDIDKIINAASWNLAWEAADKLSGL